MQGGFSTQLLQVFLQAGEWFRVQKILAGLLFMCSISALHISCRSFIQAVDVPWAVMDSNPCYSKAPQLLHCLLLRGLLRCSVRVKQHPHVLRSGATTGHTISQDTHSMCFVGSLRCMLRRG